MNSNIARISAYTSTRVTGSKSAPHQLISPTRPGIDGTLTNVGTRSLTVANRRDREGYYNDAHLKCSCEGII